MSNSNPGANLRAVVITMSDRACRGEYEDRGGAQLREILCAHFVNKTPGLDIETLLLPDEADQLRAALKKARDGGVAMVFVTGGTGVGPRDITPETVEGFCDKTIPGIMEFIRCKYGQQMPEALLSRAVAGTADSMLIYAIPGSPRAVEEYMAEILKTLDHLLVLLSGQDPH